VWLGIEKWARANVPEIYSSLQPPVATETILDTFEKEASIKLPSSVRCTLSIHNGKKTNIDREDDDVHGIFGGYSVYDHHVNVYHLNIEEISNLVKQFKVLTIAPWIKQCLPIAASYNNLKVIFIALKNGTTAEGVSYKVGQVLIPTRSSNGTLLGPPYIEAPDYITWLERYKDRLLSDTHTVRNGEIILFSEKPSTLVSATTRNITVQASPLFIPELSCIHEYSKNQRRGALSYYFAYRIRMFMPKDAPKRDSCKLRLRHWRITNALNVDTVDGEGVIGLYPVMEPGANFEYQSCCPMPTANGFMEGSFTMRLLEDNSEFDIVVPRYTFEYKSITS